MFRNYLRIAVRTLLKNKVFSVINIAGLSAGMAVALLIGLWTWDEWSFGKVLPHYDRMAQVMQSKTFSGEVATFSALPAVLRGAMQSAYGSDFKHIVLVSWPNAHVLAAGDKKISQTGSYMNTDGPEMFSLKMLYGTRNSLADPHTILLSASTARALFGDIDPTNKILKMDNQSVVKVTGVYEDFAANSLFREFTFIAPWELYGIAEPWVKKTEDLWDNNSFMMYVQLADHADMATTAAKIRNIKMDHVAAEDRTFNPVIQLQPLSRIHLYGEFNNGVSTGGLIRYVWLFALIGIFVLLLACINFMNLSTARSEKRAQEVGIRKAIGSMRIQLIIQFLGESMLMVLMAFVTALLLVQLSLPFFNRIVDKEMSILWTNGIFWLICLGLCLVTGFIAGSYPAFYLSSFRPVKILKGTFSVGRNAAIPRKALIVLQFSVSVILIIGTIVVFRQIQFAQDRPLGYNSNGLISIEQVTPDLHNHFAAIRNDLLKEGAITEMAETGSTTTLVKVTSGGFEWQGKQPGMADDFALIDVSPGFGKTVGMQISSGRDFSAAFPADSTAMILNEAAVKYMGLKDPVGQLIRWGKTYTVIGVSRDMVMNSPYEQAKPTIFYSRKEGGNYIMMKLNPAISTRVALDKIAAVCKAYSPAVPFDYRFTDQDYQKKFNEERKTGKLATIFSLLAIFISCLGLFGMASFMTEQRTKEIGIRKILGASAINLWVMLSKDFLLLVSIAILLGFPLAYYIMYQWLSGYYYHVEISWWIFIATGGGALLITMLTVSLQSVKTALANPVKSLRSE
ncbi:ABC transporter permease [Chitinophaga sp. MM2321]|uniref:ABC transporter permease n=1 Tax=Chitinophaga sp. MM2321 TaxID=3137178 RepID=UPI0032D57C5F